MIIYVTPVNLLDLAHASRMILSFRNSQIFTRHIYAALKVATETSVTKHYHSAEAKYRDCNDKCGSLVNSAPENFSPKRQRPLTDPSRVWEFNNWLVTVE